MFSAPTPAPSVDAAGSRFPAKAGTRRRCPAVFQGGALLWVLGAQGAGFAHAQPPATDVVVAAVEPRSVPQTTTLVGLVEPLRRSAVGSEMAGIVSALPIRQGDRVEAGAVLAQLNDDTLRWRLAEAEAMLNVSRAWAIRWSFEVERVRRLHGADNANEREVYDTIAENDSAKFKVSQHEAVVARLRSELAKTKIPAPFAGAVVRLETEVGQWVPAGGAIVELVDLSSVLVRVQVPEGALPFCTIQDAASVRIDALSRTFDGRIRHIIPQADVAAHTFPVEIEINNADKLLAAGMFARATIISGPTQEALTVPKDALLERDGVRYVATVLPGEGESKMGLLLAVTTGADVGDRTAITSGNLQPGMPVIVRGNERMFPFPTPVRVVDARGNPVTSNAPLAADSTKPATQSN